MKVVKKMLTKISNRISQSIWQKRELTALQTLSRRFSKDANNAAPPMVIVIEGFLGIKVLALYFIIMMLAIRIVSGREIKVVVFTDNLRNTWFTATRIYKLFFPTTIIAIDRYLTSAEQKQVDAVCKFYASHVHSVEDLYVLERDGIKLGRDIYYTYIRNQLIGTVPAIDVKVEELTRLYISNLFSCEKIISEFKPDLLLITHNCYSTFSPFFNTFLKHNIPVALTVLSAVGTGMVCGRLYTSLAASEEEIRRHPLAFTDETWASLLLGYGDKAEEEVDAYLKMRFAGEALTFNGDYHKFTTRLLNDQIRTKLSISIEDQRKTALIAAHLLWDDPGFKGIFRDYEIWIRNTLMTACENPNVIWIVKSHPAESHIGTHRTVKQIVNEIFEDALPDHIRFLDSTTDINTYSLIDFADVIVTVRGTIGFEAGCKGKKVVNAGHGPYSGLGFSLECESENEYRHCLLNIHQLNTELSNEEIHLARVGLYGYLIKKMPISNVMLRGEKIEEYSSVTEAELLADDTLMRFTKKILSKESGDLT